MKESAGSGGSAPGCDRRSARIASGMLLRTTSGASAHTNCAHHTRYAGGLCSLIGTPEIELFNKQVAQGSISTYSPKI